MRKFKVWLGVFVSIAALYLTLRGIPLRAVIVALRQMRVGFLLPAIATFLLGYIFKLGRWTLLLRSIHPGIHVRDAVPAFFIGFAANNVLPLRAGELIRAYLIGQKVQISKITAFSSITLDRVFDGLSLLLFFIPGLNSIPLPAWANQIGKIATLLFLGVLGLLISCFYAQRPLLRLVTSATQWLPQRVSQGGIRVLRSFIEGLDAFRHPFILIVCMVLSLFVWLAESFMYYFLGHAFDISLPLRGSMLVLVLLNLGLMVPSSSGYLGTFELFCVESLALFDVSRPVAFSYAVTLHGSQHLPIILIGILLVWKEHLSFTYLTKEKT